MITPKRQCPQAPRTCTHGRGLQHARQNRATHIGDLIGSTPALYGAQSSARSLQLRLLNPLQHTARDEKMARAFAVKGTVVGGGRGMWMICEIAHASAHRKASPSLPSATT